MKLLCPSILAAAVTLALAGPSRAADAPPKEPTKEGIEFFEKNIRPVLVESCYKCHSVEAKNNKKLKGKLYVDSLEGLLKGGDSGHAGIVPGEPDKSAVIKSIRYEYKDDEESLNMPPRNKKEGTGGKLPPEVIKNFEAWVKMGAPAPKTFLKPPEEKKADAGGADAHAHADPKNHWAFKAPVATPPPAVKNAAWARNDVDKFVLAKLEAKGLSPSAPLDKPGLIRRATFDLTGLPPTPEEVAAFVADQSPDAYEKLLDRLLASPRYGERWARHWLDVARYADTKGYVFQEERRYPYAYTYRDYVIEAFNADKPYDRFLIEQIAADQLDLKGDRKPLAAMGFLTLGRRFLNNIHDVTDDRIDVVTRGTMALTVACARCHDHKYDPIPTKDYYALHGIFVSSVEPKELPLLGESKGSPAFEAELKKRQDAAEAFLAAEAGKVTTAARSQEGLSKYLAATVVDGGGQSQQEAAAEPSRMLVSRWRQFIQKGGAQKEPVFAAWRMFAAVKADEFAAKSKTVVDRIAKPAAGATPVNKLVAEAFTTGEPPKSLKEVADRYAALLAKFDKADKLADADEEAIRQVLRGPESPLAVPEAERQGLLKRDARDKLRGLQNKVQEWTATSPEAPPRAMVMNDSPNPRDSQVLLRGNPNTPGPSAPRRFLEVIAGPTAKPYSKGSGRLELAESIASKDNPLTARVMVNRVWAWHFGKGIVRTPSDFGVRSDPPSHPELLDALAVGFVNDGWSVKRLHKRIMLSATYMQTSAEDGPAAAAAKAADPENTLLWRQNRQRLEFEAVRDTMLSASGQLDTTLFGRSVDIADPAQGRRTVYASIDRQNLPSMFRSFDFASPDMHSPQRSNTTVPQQALFFLNSPFSQRQAKLLLDRPDVKAATELPAKVGRIYQVLFGRDPSADEVELAKAFIDSESTKPAEPVSLAPSQAWSYGYGKYDESAKKVTFTPLPYRGKDTVRAAQKVPEATLGFAQLSSVGGHTGRTDAVIRRFTVSVPGTLNITGVLGHGQDNGDGVRGLIVSSRAGVLGQWTARNNKVETKVADLQVTPGETIDFVADPGANDTSDSFTWAPVVKQGDQRYDAAVDFASSLSGSKPAPAAKLGPWEKYVQVLMSSNEFVFVD